MRPLTPLCHLAIKHKSDKGGRHLRYGDGPCHATHEYTPIYWDLMHMQRELVKSVLEIGVNRGCGLRMWEEFFPNARIIGFDIDRQTLISAGRIECYQADQRNFSSLHNAVRYTNAYPFDLIVDDGSHQLADQALSMETLLPFLADDGVYVIEDIPREVERAEYLSSRVPPGYDYGTVFPALAHGDGWPEQLFIVTRSAP